MAPHKVLNPPPARRVLDWGVQANRRAPVLQAFDRFGHRGVTKWSSRPARHARGMGSHLMRRPILHPA